MMKIVLIVLIVLGFAWSTDAGRERIQGVLRPVGEALTPLVDRALNPSRSQGAVREQQFILRELETQRQMGRALPNAGNFHEWVKRRVESVADGLDPWGQPYYLSSGRQGPIVGSPGPDRTPGTADDITTSAPTRRR